MNKKIVPVLVLVTGLLVLLPALAQAPPPLMGGPGGPGPQGGPGMGPPPEALLKDAFGLTEAQLASLKALQDTRAQAVQTLMPQLAAAEKALQDALGATNPDPAQLGTLLLAAKGYRDQIHQADLAVAAGFKSLLTADQQKKLDGYLAMKDSVPVVMALLHLGF